MKYRVILVSNGEYKKTLHKCSTRDTSFINFRRLKTENETILFPKKYINNNSVKPVKYEIFLVKDIEDTDVGRLIKNKNGVLVNEPPIFGVWTILDSFEYNIEEDFYVYGYDNKTDRKNFKEIVMIIMKNIYDKNNIKEIIVVHNKLLIYNENSFDMVICKCKKDAQRLHHTLFEATKVLNLKNLLFLGTCTLETKGFLYDLIHERTGWSYIKIRRTTTRP